MELPKANFSYEIKPSKQDELKDYLIYIQKIREPCEIIQNPKAAEYILYFYERLSKSNRFDFINLAFDYNFTEILLNLVKYLHGLLLDLISGQNPECSGEAKKTYFLLYLCLNIIRSYSNYSIRFCNECHEMDGVQVLFKFLQNETLTDYLVTSNTPKLKHLKAVPRSIVGCLVNLSKLYSSFIAKWKEINCVGIILKLSEKLKDVDDFKISSCINKIFIFIKLNHVYFDLNIF